MNSAIGPGQNYSLKALSRSINRPSIILVAIALALVLGAMRLPFLQYLRPIGDFYIALLRICVLPFLLATIPLAVRSAVVSGSATGVVRSLVIWLLITVVAVAVASVIVTSLLFHYASPDDHTIANIGALIGRSGQGIDVEFAVDPIHAVQGTGGEETGLLAIIPTNSFASLSSNDSVRVLMFAAIFGLGMVMTERESGHSIFGALQHIQAVCIRIFDWFSLLVPIGIVALVAPQVALLGPDAFVVLALFAYAFLATSLLLLSAVMLMSALSLHESFSAVFAALLRPMMLGASTRNTLICIPIALETLKDDLKIKSEPCDLFIPIGFATIRFGTVLYFVTATLFIGILMGRTFSLVDLSMVAAFSVGASFATLGLSGVAALAPLALVLRPFGLSYEVAVPLMIIIDPIADMIRVTLNVAINCMIPVLAVGRDVPHAERTTP
jgi:Na+/H+-dicarboxylate symporter